MYAALLCKIKIIDLVTLLFVPSLVNGLINLGMGGQYCWESISTGNKYCECIHESLCILGTSFAEQTATLYHTSSLELVVT